VGQGLDVVDEGRPAVDALVERPRSDDRAGVAAVDPADEGRLLAGDVAVRGLVQFDGDAVTALVDGALEGRHQLGLAPLDAEDSPAGVEGVDGDGDAVEHEVRVGGEKDPVLGRQWLTFGPVGDDDLRPRAGGHGRHLRARGERGPASAPQPGGGDRGDQVGCRCRQSTDPGPMGSEGRVEAVGQQSGEPAVYVGGLGGARRAHVRTVGRGARGRAPITSKVLRARKRCTVASATVRTPPTWSAPARS
jgi:hypothetical protein